MLRSVTYRLGHWTFTPSAHELRSGPARVRLERRASATLSLLCERPGEVVSRDEIVARAWGRQHLSPNSVAVVIGDLRRALDIPPGEPGSIETVPKAGYRLVGSAAAEARPRRRLGAFAAIAVIVAAAIVFALWPGRPARAEVAVGSVENAMGTGRYGPLVSACGQTLLIELGRHSRDFRIVEAPAGASESPDYILQQRWVLWSGDPELVLVATDRAGHTVWSGAVYGKENQFPAKISAKVAEFAAFARTAK